MTEETVRIIHPSERVEAEIHLPPSKSYTNRALIAAALAVGTTILHNPSESDDTALLIAALRKFGITIRPLGDRLEIIGSDGMIQAPPGEVFAGNAGTALRFLTSFAVLAEGNTVLAGDGQMNLRPVNDLIGSLRSIGVSCLSNNGFPPVQVKGGKLSGGNIAVNASVSTQFVSSLLLIAPYAAKPVTIRVTGKLNAMPYVDMTLHVMRSFGAIIDTPDTARYRIDNTQRYVGHDFYVEADATSASYFLGAAAISKGRVTIAELPPHSLQGDMNFPDVLSEMGCTIIRQGERIEIHGGNLHGIEVDMNGMLDCVPTLAVVASFANGTTTIRNIAQLRYKETDRLTAVATELRKLGVKVETTDDEMIITPRPMRGGAIETYNDHRMAMSFAIAGLRVAGITIRNPICVTKSFPDFWNEFKKLEQKE